eukprot:c5496_g1_i2 orf=972-1298(+)
MILMLKEVGTGSESWQGCNPVADGLFEEHNKSDMLMNYKEGMYGADLPTTQCYLLVQRIKPLVKHSKVSGLYSIVDDVFGKSIEHRHNCNTNASSVFLLMSVNLIQKK